MNAETIAGQRHVEIDNEDESAFAQCGTLKWDPVAARLEWTWKSEHAERGFMKVVGILWIVAVSSLPPACARAVSSVQLRPEEASVIRVGQSVSLALPTDGDFSVGSAGTALALVRQERRGGRSIYVYRAVRAGEQTFVATPREPGPHGCVSCITVHYFAKVVP